MSIFTLLKSNFKHKKGSIISVIVLMFIISLSLTTIISVNKNISNRYDEATEQVKVGDLNFFMTEMNNVDEIISKVYKNSNVDHVEKEIGLTSKILINDKNSSPFIKRYDSKNFNYNVYDKNERSFIKNPSHLKVNEAYVPISFKELYKCNVGDKIKIGNKDSIIIKGFIEEPFIGSNTIGEKLLYLNSVDFDELYNNRLQDNDNIFNPKDTDSIGLFMISVYKKDSSNISSVLLKKEINNESKIVDLSTVSLSKDQSKSYTEMFSRIVSGILYIFILLLFVVVLIVITHSISTSIEMEYVNLGILKSQGFTKGHLRIIYLYQYLFSQLIGIVLGVVLSIPIIPYIGGIFATLTGLLASNNIAITNVIVILSFVIIISFLAIILKTRKIGKVSPITAITGGREQIYFDNSIKISISKRFFSISLAIRQILSNKKQYFSSIVIIGILSFFMLSIISLQNMLSQDYLSELFGGIVSDFYIKYDKSIDSKYDVEETINKISPVKKVFYIKNNYFTVDGEELLGQVTDSPELYKSVTEGRNPKYKNEIIVTDTVSKLINKSIGDKVEITYKDETKEFIICGIYQCINDIGYVFGMSLEGMQRLNTEYTVTTYDYLIEDNEKVNEIEEEIKAQYGEDIELVNTKDDDDITEYIIIGIDIISYIIYALSIIFVLVVAIMVCGRMFRKEEKEFGIYKSQGFSTNYLRFLFSIRFFILSIVGCFFGVILNYLLNDELMSFILKNVGIYKFETIYTMSTILIPCLLISISYLVFSYLISSKIKRVSTKELITE